MSSTTVTLLLFISTVSSSQARKFPLLMPQVHVGKNEPYLCAPFRIPPHSTLSITGFEPNTTSDAVHHMIIYACATLGGSAPFFDCSEKDPCGSDFSSIIYASSPTSKPFYLPEDVGFNVGRNTRIRFVVLQIHYCKKFAKNQNDRSGFVVVYSEKTRKRSAGVVVLASGGRIPPHTVTYLETVCKIGENRTIFPFAFRGHTHDLGRVVEGYAVRRSEGVDRWAVLGRWRSGEEQMFAPVWDRRAVKRGDRLAARCTMDSANRTRYTEMGSKHDDEMCNFYVMYYVEGGGEGLDMKFCVSEGAPRFYWRNEENGLNHIPEEE